MREARVVHWWRACEHHRGRGEDVHDVDPDQENPVRPGVMMLPVDIITSITKTDTPY